MAVKLQRAGTVQCQADRCSQSKRRERYEKVPLIIAQAPKQGRVAPLQHLRAWRGPGSCSSSRW